MKLPIFAATVSVFLVLATNCSSAAVDDADLDRLPWLQMLDFLQSDALVPATPHDEAGSESEGAAEQDPRSEPFHLLDETVLPGEFRRLSWSDNQSFAGLEVAVPVLVAHGHRPGPVLCITAAIHGDELNGIEIVRNVMFGINLDDLNGTVVGVPIVNIHGFQRNSRYLPDRRDLNRFFPGNRTGSSASRIAYSFFHSIVVHCDALVDLHTGSLLRTNLPQLRADLNNERIRHLTRGFGATVVLHSAGAEGTLRRAASDIGIPAVTLEAGEPMRFQPDEVSHGVRSIRSLLNHLGMDARATLWEEPRPVYYRSSWVRADTSGILSNRVQLGSAVEEGELLGNITDPITNTRTEVVSPFTGRILGKALGQAVMPGFAIYHIGIETPEEVIEPIEACEQFEQQHDGDCPWPALDEPDEGLGREPGSDPEHDGELEAHFEFEEEDG
ncbi:MAG: succinylglutamate desuccinylase/aspartoacylase family protein [Wenzhouxiangella sp.]|nr:succinylglutamate desuccinylase/aspartoacylase family protein [Wenzhouxiangella sp.]MCH8478183.1 succinylglutamate desuccinylase/aspartoacylase family protein [Wenzhouxiangella sp.]